VVSIMIRAFIHILHEGLFVFFVHIQERSLEEWQ
jgi:hypothetical protein